VRSTCDILRLHTNPHVDIQQSANGEGLGTSIYQSWNLISGLREDNCHCCWYESAGIMVGCTLGLQSLD